MSFCDRERKAQRSMARHMAKSRAWWDALPAADRERLEALARSARLALRGPDRERPVSGNPRLAEP